MPTSTGSAYPGIQGLHRYYRELLKVLDNRAFTALHNPGRQKGGFLYVLMYFLPPRQR
jgi:hypothetical protein